MVLEFDKMRFKKQSSKVEKLNMRETLPLSQPNDDLAAAQA